jgi:hypothetical protein
MRVRYLVLFLLVCAGLASAQESLFDYESLNLKLEVKNSFDIASRSTFTNVQEVSALLSWYPVDDYRQTVVETSTVPASEFNDRGYLFEWHKPSERHFEITAYSTLSTTSSVRKVSQKIDFPLKNVPSEYSPYLKSYEITDISDEIASTASELAKGEDDAFVVVSKLAGWVEQNVKYDLSTTTADASQKSTWVMENRVGVCDELTSLFISMSRSVGIPARFVSGVSYSNVNLQNDGWGPHGWAEVYLPEAGWVPVDVTYRELGFVDATHIKLKTSVDAKESSVEYSVTGQGAELRPGGLDFDVSVLGGKLKKPTNVNLDLEVLEEDVNFGSYNLVHLNVKNNNNYYTAGRFYLLNVTGVEVFDRNLQVFVLPPGAEEDYYWKLRVFEDLDKDYVYTFPISVKLDQLFVNQSFRAYARGRTLSESYVNSKIPKEEILLDSRTLSIGCSSQAELVYLEEPTTINCSVSNIGSKSLDLKVCLDANCTFAKMGAGSRKDFKYNLNFKDVGITTARFSAQGAGVLKESYVVFEVEDEPELEVRNLSATKVIGYDDLGEAKFTLAKKSVSPAENVVITIENNLVRQVWEVERIDYNYDIHFMFSGHDLVMGENTFNIRLDYESDDGRKFTENETFKVELHEESSGKKLLSSLNVLAIRLNNWVDKNVYKQSSTVNTFRLLLRPA